MNIEIDAAPLITINDFRRRFFSGKTRPAVKTVIDWIDAGTVEGRRLRAVCINGRYYIRESDALDFLSAAPTSPRSTLSERRRLDRQARINEARETLKKQYGFNYL